MENNNLGLVRRIIVSPLFLTQSTNQQQEILNKVLETGEITQQELVKVIREEIDRKMLVKGIENFDYTTFLDFILTGNIRGEKLLALCSGSKKLNEYCNRVFQLVNATGTEIEKEVQDQYLFRLLLNRMRIRIPLRKSPRQVYIEKTVGGRVYSFGNNDYGQLGLGYRNEGGLNIPTNISNFNHIIQVAAGSDQTLCLNDRGEVWTFGFNNNRIITVGEIENNNTLVPILIPDLINIIDIQAGAEHFVCLNNRGDVWCLGADETGSLGLGDLDTQVPAIINPYLKNIIEISTGYGHTLCLDTQGKVWAFGDNQYGQLGFGDTINRNIPTINPSLKNIVKISCGGGHTLCLDNQGRVWSFGQNNDHGQCGLGDNTIGDVHSPTLVPNLTNIVQVEAGDSHSLCLNDKGRVWAFGNNTSGQLGIGSLPVVSYPVLIQDLDDIIQVSCGNDHSLCLDADGWVWSFGNNEDGQLGLEDNKDRRTPKVILPLNDTISINCGCSTSYCIRRQ
jgi:alpha-tubulin suppressor-like RCC1 family protein